MYRGASLTQQRLAREGVRATSGRANATHQDLEHWVIRSDDDPPYHFLLAFYCVAAELFPKEWDHIGAEASRQWAAATLAAMADHPDEQPAELAERTSLSARYAKAQQEVKEIKAKLVAARGTGMSSQGWHYLVDRHAQLGKELRKMADRLQVLRTPEQRAKSRRIAMKNKLRAALTVPKGRKTAASAGWGR